ncbi:putative membrane protein YeiH [Micrococcus cohnii]|uniref:Putative membrane protein YeiH n=2 Tax=Micrococcus TaxID=1269 RepID=A0A7W7M3U3_9MICC|nr:putative membrane protein YeiH [Micrococcus cohnii]
MLTTLSLLPTLVLGTGENRDPRQLEKDVPEQFDSDGQVAETVSAAVTTLDLIGVVFFAISGAVLAVRKGYDIVGSLLLALIVATGGGIIRDLIVNDQVPAAFRNPLYLVLPVVATLLVFFRVFGQSRGHQAVMLFDSVGLAVYCVVGTRIALLGGIDSIGAIVLGLVSAVGGGMLRDVVAGEPPAIFGGRGWYALSALIGATLTAVLGAVEWLNILTSVGVMAGVLALRLLSLRQGWPAPGADIAGLEQAQREDPDAEPPVEDVRDRESADGGVAAPGEGDADEGDLDEGATNRPARG